MSNLAVFPGAFSLVAQTVKNLPAMKETWVQYLGQEDPLKKGMTTRCSIPAWKIPWTEEPDGLQSMGSQRVRHNWGTDKHMKWVPLTESLKLAKHSTQSSTYILYEKKNIYIYKYLILKFWLCHAACRILVTWPEMEPAPPAGKKWSLNHWTTRKVPLTFSVTSYNDSTRYCHDFTCF